ncbi:MAG: LemA family protein [Syntrophomonadaceae bacterium]|nr:LemA family protein [Syntrophomonadaceae bacterium]MDD3890402.1 LemA family protein [Syntrophomonadaceae bacterium]MDD4548458.1 LemA family protein [Syntrophomonadaceae bacterium]
MIIGIIIVAALLVLLAVFLISTYNSLVQLRQRVQNAWSQVDVQLKRRYDLIPNLVNAVKGYAQHEKDTLQKVTQARNMAIAAGSVAEQAQAENLLSGALKSLFAVAEAYPELKANTNFMQLQNELTDTESKIAFSRQFYNDTVQKFNTKIELFPANLVAGMLGFGIVDYFSLQGEPEARQTVQVNF